jgi:hypothetical protein
MVCKFRDYFTKKLTELKEEKCTIFKQATISSSTLLATYKVACRVAKCKKPHTIVEELIMPVAKQCYQS